MENIHDNAYSTVAEQTCLFRDCFRRANRAGLFTLFDGYEKICARHSLSKSMKAVLEALRRKVSVYRLCINVQDRPDMKSENDVIYATELLRIYYGDSTENLGGKHELDDQIPFGDISKLGNYIIKQLELLRKMYHEE